MTAEEKKDEIDDFHSSVVLKELMPDEKLLFARLEDPVPRMILMTKWLMVVVIMILVMEIYVKHHSPPTLGNAILFAMVWLVFLLLFRKVYKVVDAITTKRFIRVRPGISVHFGWLKDVDRVVLSKPHKDGTNMEIILTESGKYEARNLKKPELKPRVHHGVKKIAIHNLQSAQELKEKIEAAIASAK